MEIFHFETNKIQNLRPYLNIRLSNSKSSGTLEVGVTDNQTIFFSRYELSKKNGKKLNTKDDIFVYKIKWYPYFEGYQEKQEIGKDGIEQFFFSIENGKIVFNELLNFSKLCEYHKTNKSIRVEKLEKEIKQRELEKVQARIERKQREEAEKQKELEKEILPNKFTFIAMIYRLDQNSADYGNWDLDFGNYSSKNIDELTEDEAEEVFYLNGGEVDTISALIEHEKLNEDIEYDQNSLTIEYKNLSQEDKNKVDKYLLELIEEIGFD